METIYLTTKRNDYISQDYIIEVLQSLPKDKPINSRVLNKYYKEGLLSFWPGTISKRFGSLKEACKQAGVRCDALYGKEHQEHLAKSNIKWNKKKVIKAVKSVEGKFNTVKEYEKLSKGNKKLPSRETISKYLKVNNVHKAFKIIGVKYKSYYWSNKRIIKTLMRLYQQHGPFPKNQINKFREERKLCGAKLIKDRFGSLDKFARYTGITFCPADMKGNGKGIFTRIGKNEDLILSNIEEENNITLLRQHYVVGKFVDGYDPINNVVYEIDESNHKYQLFKDIKRENLIRQALDCDFVRIKDKW